ncbi:hypothetical protein O181_014263 [Austropuccinia psidii MF-1]|uniref:Uncharacterized protein n=1 Tax=Austropuccinia psidii MF-1 TaxID=1389203 RepID=A0A9Q3GNW1_9BASI|nr:hypothetical protein [Austropuccinia psidii MF-1]
MTFSEIDMKRNFKFSEWEPGSGTLDTDYIGPQETEAPILGISSSELYNKFFNSVDKCYAKHKQYRILISLLKQMCMSPELESQSEELCMGDYKDNKFPLIDGLL